MESIWILNFLLFIYGECLADQYRQERAVMEYCNPEYLINCYTITKRAGKGQPYRTNVTGTTLKSWNNNVTLTIMYGTGGRYDMTIKLLYCDSLKNKWLNEFLSKYSNIPRKCPVVAGSYGIYNMELPPKNFPLPIPKEDMNIKFYLNVTDTKEAMGRMSMVLRGK